MRIKQYNIGIPPLAITISFIILFGTFESVAQSYYDTVSYPEIGKPIPYFELKGIRDYHTRKVNSNELKGKPYILYFWSKYCKSAVKGVFKADRLYKEFNKDLDIFLIGGHKKDVSKNYFYYQGMEPGKENHYKLYERMKNKSLLHIPMVFDSTLFYSFLPSTGVPQVIYVDKNGIIQAITYALDSGKTQALIQGKNFFFVDLSAKGRELKAKNKYSREVPFLIDGNGGIPTHFMFRSVLSKYTPKMQKVPSIFPTITLACEDNYLGNKGRLEGRTTLLQLYRLAYLGYSNASGFYYKDYEHKEDFSQIVLELENDSLFKNVDFEKRNNLFVYSLIVPPYKVTPEYLMQVMQNDLASYFGYTVRIEKRQMPYWSITIDTNSVRTYKSKNQNAKGRGALISDGVTQLGCKNKTIDNYLSSILSSVSFNMDIPIINESQANWRIDIPLTDVFMLDFNEIKSVLKKQGFILKRQIKEFDVLVISN